MNIRLLGLLPLVCGLLLGCAMVDGLRPRAKPPVPISVEFRLVDDSSDAPEMPIKGSDERVRLAQDVIIGRADIVSAEAQVNQFGQSSYDVVITVTPEAAERLRATTAGNIGKRMAIVVDGVVLTAPVIQAEIGGGVAVISGNFGAPEAYDIADRLNSIAP